MIRRRTSGVCPAVLPGRRELQRDKAPLLRQVILDSRARLTRSRATARLTNIRVEQVAADQRHFQPIAPALAQRQVNAGVTLEIIAQIAGGSSTLTDPADLRRQLPARGKRPGQTRIHLVRRHETQWLFRPYIVGMLITVVRQPLQSLADLL